ncbi:C2 domain-containing protein 3, partial [Ophiophagus hannah]
MRVLHKRRSVNPVSLGSSFFLPFDCGSGVLEYIYHEGFLPSHALLRRAGSRYKEHVQNVRRFHTSLQQAEEKTEPADGLDSLSLSSHTSLFRALRKNLDELDEIQRYFSGKLTRPLTDLSAPCNTTEGLDIQRPFSRRVNPEEDHLQKKPIHQVSQFGSQSVGKLSPSGVAVPAAF